MELGWQELGGSHVESMSKSWVKSWLSGVGKKGVGEEEEGGFIVVRGEGV